MYYTLYLVSDESVNLLDNAIYPPHVRGGCTFASNIHCEELCKAYVGNHVLSPAVFMEVAEQHWKVFDKLSSSFDLSVFAIIVSVMFDIEEKFKEAIVQPTALQNLSRTIIPPTTSFNIKPRATKILDTSQSSHSYPSSSRISEPQYSSLMSSSQKSSQDDYLSLSYFSQPISRESYDQEQCFNARHNGVRVSSAKVYTENNRPSYKQNNDQQIFLRRNENDAVNNLYFTQNAPFNHSSISHHNGERRNSSSASNYGLSSDHVYDDYDALNEDSFAYTQNAAVNNSSISHHNGERRNSSSASNYGLSSDHVYDDYDAVNEDSFAHTQNAAVNNSSISHHNGKRRISSSASNYEVSSAHENDDDEEDINESGETQLDEQDSFSKRRKEGAVYRRHQNERWANNGLVSSSSSSSSSINRLPMHHTKHYIDGPENDRHESTWQVSHSPNSKEGSPESSDRRSNVNQEESHSTNLDENFTEGTRDSCVDKIKRKARVKPATTKKIHNVTQSRSVKALSNYNENPNSAAVIKNKKSVNSRNLR